MAREQKLRRPLEKAVAHFLFVLSKDAAPEEAGLYRAAALALIGEPVSAELMREAAKARSNDQPLYQRSDIRMGPDLEDVWDRLD